MPIFIALSEIAHHVKMSGLIAATIADETLVSRFSYSFFKRLNSSGRFVIILDGFDEMKFGLTFEEFNQLFSQVHELISPKAKILVLGRPSAFLSESEELAVLSGAEADNYSVASAFNWLIDARGNRSVISGLPRLKHDFAYALTAKRFLELLKFEGGEEDWSFVERELDNMRFKQSVPRHVS
jgi:hypothetical protein